MARDGAEGVADTDYFGDHDFQGNAFYSGPLIPLMVYSVATPLDVTQGGPWP